MTGKLDDRITTDEAEGLLKSCMVVFNYNMEFYRKRANLTQADLAYRMRCQQPRITLMERSTTANLQILTAVRIANILGVSITDLFTPLPSINYTPKSREIRKKRTTQAA